MEKPLYNALITTPQGWGNKKEEIGMQADKTKVGNLLKTARGQIDGILNMIEEDRYCIDISHQLMATMAILNKANKEVLSAHLKTCVRNAESEQERDEKIDELIEIMGKVFK